MTQQQIINVGVTENDGTGDSIQTAGSKINHNFSQLYTENEIESTQITFIENNITATASNANLVLTAAGNGSIKLADVKISGTSLSSDDSTGININENVNVDGTVTATTYFGSAAGITGATISTVGDLSATGSTLIAPSNADLTFSFSGTGSLVMPAITINDNNIIATRSNDDINLDASLSGAINVTDITIDSSFRLKDNEITATRSNDSINLVPSGTGSVVISKVDANAGTVDGTTIGATTPAAGTFTTIEATTLSTTGITITDNEITSTQSNDKLIFTGSGSGSVIVNGFTLPASDGSSGQILQTDGSKTLSFATSPLILGVSTFADTSQNISFRSITELNANTAIGAHEIVTTGQVTMDTFATSKYDSAWYHVVTKDVTNTQFAVAKYSLLTGTTNDGSTTGAFLSQSNIVRSSSNAHISADASISGSNTLLLGQGTSADNAIRFYRIGLGDNDSSVTSGNVTTIVNSDVDSASESLDTFAHASYRGAKYYVSAENSDTGEVQNLEALVTHNGSDAFINVHNDHFSGNNSLLTMTAGITGANVVVSGAALTPNTKVRMYRILLSDSESSSSGDQVSVIGATSVSNLSQTTIDTNSFRGTANPDFSTTQTASTFAKTDFDSVWFHVINRDQTNNEFNMEKLSVHHGTNSDGSTQDAFITSSSAVKSGVHNDVMSFDVDFDGSDVRLRGTGVSDGSSTISNSMTYYALGLGDNTTTSTIGKIGTHAGVTFGGANETRVDTLTATGTCTSILSTQRTLADFDKTAYDSAWFLGVSNDIENSGLATFKYSVMHGTTSDGSTQDAFITSSSITRTDISHNHLETDADISGSKIRLLGNGGRLDDSSKSNSNTMAYYRIGLGDNDSSGYTSDDGNADTNVVTVGGAQETIIDAVTAEGTHATLSASGTTTVADFTAGTYDGALFFVVNKDVANGSFETQKISLCHNLQDSFMTSSSVTSTDQGDQHPVYTTDIVTSGDSTSKVRLKSTDSDGSTVSANNTMAYYRIGLGDGDSTGYVGELGQVLDITLTPNIGSATATLDSFAHASNNGAKYFLTVVNQATGETGNIEALVTHDGTDAYITTYNEFFTGNNSLISLSAVISGSDVIFRGSATAGDSTKVIVNRLVLFSDSESGETNSDSSRKIVGNVIVSSSATTFDTFMVSETDAAHYVITGQKGSDENFICEAVVVTDGSNVFVSQGPNVSTKENDMLEITATISGGTVSVKASSTSGASTVQAYAIKLKAPESSTATVDSFAASSFRGAKYFLSFNNLDSNEVSNVECLVVHDGTDAFILQYNEHFSGSASLINGDLTADISGGQVRLRCVTAQDNTRITFYRIILSDAETDITGGTNVNVIGDVDVSSSPTAIDTFDDTEIDGAHYVIIGYNSSEGAASIQEANVITNGQNAFVSSGPYVSSKETNQLDLTAAHNGSSTVTLSASSTSGGSTKVNAYRIHMKAPVGQTDNLDTWSTSSYRGAKYYISAKETVSGFTSNIECLVVHDGTDAYITAFNEHFSHVSLVTLTADIVGGNLRLRCQGNIPDVKVKFYRIRLADSESNATGADSKLGDTVTVSSGATAIDTFDDTEYTGAHYVLVANNSTEGAASISEFTVITDGIDASVAQGPEVSSKESGQIFLTAAHNGSSTVTVSASSTSGGSTTVNLFRIHMLRPVSTSYTIFDSFASSTYNGAHYVVVAKKVGSNDSQISEIQAVTNGSDTFINSDPIVSSTGSNLVKYTAGNTGTTAEIRAEAQDGTSSFTVNAYRIHLLRGSGSSSSLTTLDTFDKTEQRSVKYLVQVHRTDDDKFEFADINVTHDGTNAFLSIFGQVGTQTTDLVTYTADISGDDVRLRGEVAGTQDHTVKIVKRNLNI